MVIKQYIFQFFLLDSAIKKLKIKHADDPFKKL